MILDVIVNKTADGFTAEIPSLKGCETWAADEDEVLNKVIELVKFYLKLTDSTPLQLDKARGNFHKSVYKLVFNKN